MWSASVLLNPFVLMVYTSRPLQLQQTTATPPLEHSPTLLGAAVAQGKYGLWIRRSGFNLIEVSLGKILSPRLSLRLCLQVGMCVNVKVKLRLLVKADGLSRVQPVYVWV